MVQQWRGLERLYVPLLPNRSCLACAAARSSASAKVPRLVAELLAKLAEPTSRTTSRRDSNAMPRLTTIS
jgi:hypothetical protein